MSENTKTNIVLTAEEVMAIDLSHLKAVMEGKQNLSEKKGN